jgi:hypothetical protein
MTPDGRSLLQAQRSTARARAEWQDAGKGALLWGPRVCVWVFTGWDGRSTALPELARALASMVGRRPARGSGEHGVVRWFRLLPDLQKVLLVSLVTVVLMSAVFWAIVPSAPDAPIRQSFLDQSELSHTTRLMLRCQCSSAEKLDEIRREAEANARAKFAAEHSQALGKAEQQVKLLMKQVDSLQSELELAEQSHSSAPDMERLHRELDRTTQALKLAEAELDRAAEDEGLHAEEVERRVHEEVGAELERYVSHMVSQAGEAALAEFCESVGGTPGAGWSGDVTRPDIRSSGVEGLGKAQCVGVSAASDSSASLLMYYQDDPALARRVSQRLWAELNVTATDVDGDDPCCDRVFVGVHPVMGMFVKARVPIGRDGRQLGMRVVCYRREWEAVSSEVEALSSDGSELAPRVSHVFEAEQCRAGPPAHEHDQSLVLVLPVRSGRAHLLPGLLRSIARGHEAHHSAHHRALNGAAPWHCSLSVVLVPIDVDLSQRRVSNATGGPLVLDGATLFERLQELARVTTERSGMRVVLAEAVEMVQWRSKGDGTFEPSDWIGRETLLGRVRDALVGHPDSLKEASLNVSDAASLTSSSAALLSAPWMKVLFAALHAQGTDIPHNARLLFLDAAAASVSVAATQQASWTVIPRRRASVLGASTVMKAPGAMGWWSMLRGSATDSIQRPYAGPDDGGFTGFSSDEWRSALFWEGRGEPLPSTQGAARWTNIGVSKADVAVGVARMLRWTQGDGVLVGWEELWARQAGGLASVGDACVARMLVHVLSEDVSVSALPSGIVMDTHSLPRSVVATLPAELWLSDAARAASGRPPFYEQDLDRLTMEAVDCSCDPSGPRMQRHGVSHCWRALLWASAGDPKDSDRVACAIEHATMDHHFSTLCLPADMFTHTLTTLDPEDGMMVVFHPSDSALATLHASHLHPEAVPMALHVPLGKDHHYQGDHPVDGSADSMLTRLSKHVKSLTSLWGG